ncbi:MAG: hypothetical protein ACP5O7_12940 [Phycisphaerae bacterium]
MEQKTLQCFLRSFEERRALQTLTTGKRYSEQAFGLLSLQKALLKKTRARPPQNYVENGKFSAFGKNNS